MKKKMANETEAGLFRCYVVFCLGLLWPPVGSKPDFSMSCGVCSVKRNC